jgi:hypothetical protein
MTKIMKRGIFLTLIFTNLMFWVFQINFAGESLLQYTESSRIIIEDNDLNFTSSLPNLPSEIANLSENVVPRAIIEYSIQTFMSHLNLTQQLFDLTATVKPRISVEYAVNIFKENLVNPPDLPITPRIRIEYSNMVFSFNLTRPQAIFPWIIVCDENGQEKSVFNLSDDVYLRGANFPPLTNISVYIISDDSPASPQNAIATHLVFTNANGELPLTIIWENATTQGNYDIWIDINQNNIYDENVDTYVQSTFGIYAFTVIPELTSYHVLATLILTTLIFTIFYKLTHHK